MSSIRFLFKDDAEQKKQQQIEKKLANKKAYDEEVELVCSSSKASVKQPAKITRAQIEQERALETLKKNEEKEALEQQKNVTLPNEDLAENVNRLSVEGESASGIDEALQILGKKSSVEVVYWLKI